MAGLVLDASVALAWVLPGESDGPAAALLGRVAAEAAVVPGLWRLEVGNALAMAERRGRIQAHQLAEALRHLDALPIRTDPETGARAWAGTLDLARRHQLSLYDACYLELARRLGLPLASLDAALRHAAAGEGVGLA